MVLRLTVVIQFKTHLILGLWGRSNLYSFSKSNIPEITDPLKWLTLGQTFDFFNYRLL